MIYKTTYPYAQTAAFLWLGFVLSISFMEAWLKFQAPGISVPLGLGIGQLVFGALNIMEWVFAAVIAANLFLGKNKSLEKPKLLFFIPVFLLLMQSIWLLPALDVRASALISGEEIPDSNLHYFYIGFEILKVFVLFMFGINQYTKTDS